MRGRIYGVSEWWITAFPFLTTLAPLASCMQPLRRSPSCQLRRLSSSTSLTKWTKRCPRLCPTCCLKTSPSRWQRVQRVSNHTSLPLLHSYTLALTQSRIALPWHARFLTPKPHPWTFFNRHQPPRRLRQGPAHGGPVPAVQVPSEHPGHGTPLAGAAT